MKTISKFAVVIGLVFTPCIVLAQAPATEPATAPVAEITPTIPLDQQPTKEQLNKLFEVMHLKDQMRAMMTMMPALIEQQMKEQEKQITSKLPDGAIKPEQQEEMSNVINKYMEKALNIYTVNHMLDDMATIYQRHLSRADVDAYIVFYGSDAGQHLLKLTPVMMQEYMPMAMKRVQESTKTLTDEMAREMKECVKTDEPAQSDVQSKNDKPGQK